MKKIILSLAFCLIATFTFAQTEYKGQKFGEAVTPGDVKPAAKMEAAMGSKTTTDMKVEGKVVDVCKKKGCWMTLEMANGEPMRVTFKDYAFFVPKEGMEGNRAIIEGKVKRTMTDVATLKHYAEDAGKSVEEIAAITEDKDELAFEATGVIILNTEEKSL